MEDTKIYVPPLKIQGIKTKLVPTIMQNVILDYHTTWVEPFMGSGVVGFNIAPESAIFADSNPCIIDFYNALKSQKITSGIAREFLEQEGALLAEKDDKYYYEVRERFNKHRAPLDFLFLNRSCFNGMIRFNKTNGFNVPYGHKPQRFAKAYITKIVNQIKHIEQQLSCKDWTFVCQPFSQTISEATKDCFIYCDPPYIGRHVDYYDSWDENDEIELRNCLVASCHQFMLSTWDHNQYRINEYIETLWGFCHKINIEHFYHIGAKESNRNPMVEALLMNYIPTGNQNSLMNTYEQLSFDLEFSTVTN
ncbi:MAG: Dam family site-specific DNA-(adenine-N6)-methyltransferase [Oscillospiraceae bacterium]|nr:Dam family site-specific DNA-(adenine-N6)-methyltransferase [Oscillospiraceae bacterium]